MISHIKIIYYIWANIVNTMEKTILELLTTKFQGLRADILSRIAAKLAKTATTEDAAKAAVEALTMQDVLDQYTESRVTEASQTAVANYEKRHNLKDGKAVNPSGDDNPDKGGQDKPDTADTDGHYNATLKALEAINKRLDNIEQGRVVNERTMKLQSTLKGAPEKYAKRITDDFGRYQFKDDADFDGWLVGIKADADELIRSNKGQGGLFSPPAGGGGGSGQVPESLKKAVSERAAGDEAKDKKPY